MPRVIIQKSSGTWWKVLLGVLLGIVLGITSVFGGLAITAAYVNTGTLLGDYSYVLTDEYQNKTILDIVLGVTSGEIKFDNLNDVAKVTPELEKIFDTINESFANAGLNVEIRFDDIKDEPWATLDVKIIDTFKTGVTLADVLKVEDDSEPILKYLSYPKNDDGTFDKDHPYTLKDFMDDSSFFSNLIDKLTIGDVVKPDDDNLLLKAITDYTLKDLENKDKLYSIELGTLFSESDKENNPMLKTLADNHWTINDLSDGDKFKTLKIGEIVEPTPGTLMDAIKDKTVGDLDSSDAFDDVEVGAIITVNEGSTPIIKYLEHKQLGELKDDDFVNDMYISDIFTPTQIADSKVLTGLNNLPNPKHDTDPSAPEYGCQVGDIGTRVDELKLKDVMDTTSGNKTVKSLENERIGNLTDAINKLEIGSVIEYHEKEPSDGKYYSDTACTQELSPVLTRLIGKADEPVEVTTPYTITLKNDEFSHFVISDGGENKTDYLKISDYIQKTDIAISKHVESEVVTWISDGGTGMASPERDPYVETFTLTLNPPTEWEHVYYYNCNKPTKVNDMNETISDLKIKDVMKTEGTIFEKPKIANTRVENASGLFDTIKSEVTLGEVITINSGSTKILRTLKDTKLDQIGTKVDNLLFADVVDYYEKEPSDGKYYSDPGCTKVLPQILTTFIDNNVEIKNMTSAIDDLTISDVLSPDQRSDRYLSHIPDDTRIADIGSAVNNLSLIDVFEDQIFDTSGNLISTWKYLLIESTETWIPGNPHKDTLPFEGYNCKTYKVGELTKLKDNMTNNMTRASLNELQRDGIVDLNNGKAWDDPTGFLAKTITVPFTPPAGKTTFGELTLKEFSDMIASIAV